MQKNSNRKGLALAAAFSLIVSMFGSMPAQAATNGANIGAYPLAGTTFAGSVEEDFPVFVQLKPGNVNSAFSSDNLVFKVEKTAGVNMDLRVSASATAVDLASATSVSPGVSANVPLAQAGSASATVSGIVNGAGVAHLNFKASSASAHASWSAVTLTVTAWIDNQGGAKNDVIDTDEWFTTFSVTLATPAGFTSTLALTQPNSNDTTVTASATVTGLNTDNLSGVFYLAMSASDAIYTTDNATTQVGTELSGATVALRGGVISESWAVTGVTANSSISAALRYVPTAGTPSDIYAGYLVGTASALGATPATITQLLVDVIESDHVTASATPFAVRPNQTYTVRVQALTNSVSVSGVALTVALSGETLVDGSKMISINGGAATSSYPTALALTTAGTDGYATFTLTTTGFADTDNVLVTAKSGNVTSAAPADLVATTPAYSIVNDYDLYVTAPGAAVNLGYAVEDQWQVAQSVGTYRLQVTRGGTGFAYATTVSEVAVAAGAATFAFTPSPATKTGSAVVSAVLQKWDANLNSWISGGAADVDVTVNVTSVADAFSVAPAVSFSASVSYFPSTVSFKTVTGTVKNAGAAVVVSGDSSLVFRAASGKATSSSTITVLANASGVYTFDVASLHDGNHTISQTVGTAVTTSVMVVDAVSGDLGKTITFDTTAIAAGSTATVTGTLVDANGNPVYTTGSATIAVTYTGAGIPIGTMPTETDEDGEFSFTVLTGANDKGTAAVTAVYAKSGAATAAADKITATQTITVGAAAVVAPVADQKLTVGTFNGYIAIYAKGYAGQKLSAKVAGKWLTVAELSSFQRVVRKTGAGYEIKVDLYIDGVFAQTSTTVTK